VDLRCWAGAGRVGGQVGFFVAVAFVYGRIPEAGRMVITAMYFVLLYNTIQYSAVVACTSVSSTKHDQPTHTQSVSECLCEKVGQFQSGRPCLVGCISRELKILAMPSKNLERGCRAGCAR
jgi:hypothetical protein